MFKRFVKNLRFRIGARVAALGLALGLPALASAADGEGSYTVPASVTSGLNDLKAAGSAIADAIIPVIVSVGLAFLGCWIALMIFRWFRRAAGR